MFFDSVALSKKSWHYRLQNWTFGQVPYTANFCPYFWLTIFCVLVFPFVGTARGIKWLAPKAIYLLAPFAGVFWLFEKAVTFIDDKICKPYTYKQTVTYASKMDDEEAYMLAKYLFGDRFSYYDGELEYEEFYLERFKNNIESGYYSGVSYEAQVSRKFRIQNARWEAWKEEAGDSWEDRLVKVRERYRQQVIARYKWKAEQAKLKAAEEERLKEAARHRKKMFSKLVQYTKYFVLLPIGIAAIYLVYWLGIFGLFISEHWSAISGFFGVVGSGIWYAIVNWGPWVLGVIFAVVALIALVAALTPLLKRCMMVITIPKPIKKATSVLWSPFGFIFSKLGAGIKAVTEFFAIYIKTFKEDNCPAINWED